MNNILKKDTSVLLGIYVRQLLNHFLGTDWTYKVMKMPVRSEKVEEIKAIWVSPKFMTNAQRLVCLMRHCKKSRTWLHNK